jgi:hypothetical protein
VLAFIFGRFIAARFITGSSFLDACFWEFPWRFILNFSFLDMFLGVLFLDLWFKVLFLDSRSRRSRSGRSHSGRCRYWEL